MLASSPFLSPSLTQLRQLELPIMGIFLFTPFHLILKKRNDYSYFHVYESTGFLIFFPFLLLTILYINKMNFSYFTDSWDSITPPLQGSRNGYCKWVGAKITRAEDSKVYINKISSGWDIAVAFIKSDNKIGLINICSQMAYNAICSRYPCIRLFLCTLFGDLSTLLILLVVCSLLLPIFFCAGVWQNDYYLFCKWVFRYFLVLAIMDFTSQILLSKVPSYCIYNFLGYSIKDRFATSHAMDSDIFSCSVFYAYSWLNERYTIIIYFSSEIIKEVAKVTKRPQLTSLIFFIDLSQYLQAYRMFS